MTLKERMRQRIRRTTLTTAGLAGLLGGCGGISGTPEEIALVEMWDQRRKWAIVARSKEHVRLLQEKGNVSDYISFEVRQGHYKMAVYTTYSLLNERCIDFDKATDYQKGGAALIVLWNSIFKYPVEMAWTDQKKTMFLFNQRYRDGRKIEAKEFSDISKGFGVNIEQAEAHQIILGLFEERIEYDPNRPTQFTIK